MEDFKLSKNDVKNILTSLWNECNGENPNFKSIIAKAYTLGEKYKEFEIKEKINNIFKDNGKQ